MIKKITSVKSVRVFAKQLIAEGISFHPDDNFHDYVFFKENKPCYTKEEADFRNALMEQCFKICEKEGVDIYEIMLEVTLRETGMDKFITLSPETDHENRDYQKLTNEQF